MYSLLTKMQRALTFVTWSCTRRAGSSACSPSAPGLRRRSCRRCARSWRSRSWWHRCQGSAARWGNPRTTAPSWPPPWGWALDWRLKQKYEVLLPLSLLQQVVVAHCAHHPSCYLHLLRFSVNMIHPDTWVKDNLCIPAGESQSSDTEWDMRERLSTGGEGWWGYGHREWNTDTDHT